MKTVLRILEQDFELDCAKNEQRRIEDLAQALDGRLQGCAGDAAGVRRLAIVALALMDEAQTGAAALLRAQGEIERLNDLIAEARIEAVTKAVPGADYGRLPCLRAHGFA